jgi:hypothetical protein
MKKKKKQKVTSSIISQMEDIKSNLTYRKLRRRIRSLKKINFDLVNENDIAELINKSLPLLIEVFPQNPSPTDKAIWRARINEDAGCPYTNTDDISYKKNTTADQKYGRCNLAKESCFYGSDGIEVAVSEVCDRLSKDNPVLYLTVGGWKLKELINVSIMCHSMKAHKRSGDLVVAYQSLLDLKKKSAKSKSEIRQWKITNKFLAHEFSKKVRNGEENKYVISAVYSHSLLKSQNSLGIFYPSVAYKLYGHNAAYCTKLIDENKLVLKEVHYIKCSFVKKNHPPKIEKLKYTNNIQNNSIIW